MQVLKFIKQSYRYYKNDSDTAVDLDQIFGFVQTLDKKRIKLIKKTFPDWKWTLN